MLSNNVPLVVKK